jgi:hypothetical protein
MRTASSGNIAVRPERDGRGVRWGAGGVDSNGAAGLEEAPVETETSEERIEG